VLNQVIIAKDLNFINEIEYTEIRQEISKITNMLNALRNVFLK
jgi:four helix bundle protein